MDDVTIFRTGMYCMTWGTETELKFTPVPRKPYRHTVECATCGESWETNSKPEEFGTYADCMAVIEAAR